jgi:hypothetical protein
MQRRVWKLFELTLAHFAQYDPVKDFRFQVTAAAVSLDFLDFSSFLESGMSFFFFRRTLSAPPTRAK